MGSVIDCGCHEEGGQRLIVIPLCDACQALCSMPSGSSLSSSLWSLGALQGSKLPVIDSSFCVCVYACVCVRECVSRVVFKSLLGTGDSSLSLLGLLSKCLCYDSWAAFIQTKSLLSAVHLLA